MRRFLCVLSVLTSPFFFGRINMRRFLCVLSLMAFGGIQLRRPPLTLTCQTGDLRPIQIPASQLVRPIR